MSKKDNKDFDIPRGADKQKPTMRTSSKSSKRKLGRGFSDIMATPTSVEKQKSVENKVATPSYGAEDVSVNNSRNVNKDTGVVTKVTTSISSTVTNNDFSGVVNSGNSAPDPMDSFAPVPPSNEFDTTQQSSNTSVKKDTQNLQDFSEISDLEEPLGMDEASIESVITGNPKSKSGVDSRAERKKKRRRKKVKITLIVIAIILAVAGLVTGGILLYTSDNFKIEQIEINGALHLTEDEVLKLANVPDDVTLLQVDTDTIITRLKRDAWIQEVKIDKKFPDTLVINIIERSITAIVEVPTTKDSGSSVSTSTSATSKNTTVRMWAISADKIWLMPIPDQNSEVGKTLNQQIYSDVAGIMHIVDVLPSVNPEIGCYCTDPTLQCAIDVVASMTTELKSQVKYVKASDGQSATLILNNGVEVAVGTNEDMRDKERIVLELLQKHEGKISFINVRNINNPT